jgi:hypothetical protein
MRPPSSGESGSRLKRLRKNPAYATASSQRGPSSPAAT